jgi:hypothetical protein
MKHSDPPPRKRQKQRTSRLSLIIFVASLICLLAASIFMGYKQGVQSPYYEPYPGDMVDYNNVLHEPYQTGDVYVNPLSHSFLFKIPLFLAQNLAGLSETTLLVSGILLILAMNSLVAYLIYRFSGHNKIIAGIGFLLLTSLTIMTNSPESYYSPESWLTLRNIEIPLTIFCLLGAVHLKKFMSLKTLGLETALGLLFASDRLMLYILVLAVGIFLLFDFVRQKKRAIKRNLPLIGFCVLAVIMMAAWCVLVRSTDILRFPDNPMPAALANDMWSRLAGEIMALLYAFNSSIFSPNISANILAYLPNALICVVAVMAFAIILRKFYLSKESSLNKYGLRDMSFLICYALGDALLYFCIAYQPAITTDWRYLIFIRTVGVLAIVFAIYSYKKEICAFLSRIRHSKIIILVVTIVILVTEILVITQIYATGKRINDVRKTYYVAIARVLEKENIHVFLGYFNDVQMAKFIYDQENSPELQINQFHPSCNFNAQEIKYSWMIADDSRVAVMPMRFCPAEEIEKIFGKPAKIIYIQNNRKKPLWIYDYDIRAKYDMRRFDQMYPTLND